MSTCRRFLFCVASFMLCLAASGPMAFAQTTLWWDGSSSATWGTVPNWSTTSTGGSDPAAIPGASDNVIYNIDGLNTNQTVTIGGANRSANSITFRSTGTTQLDRASTASTNANNITLGAGGLTLESHSGAVTVGDTLSTGQKVDFRASTSLSITNNSSSQLLFNRNWTSSAASGTTIITVAGSGSGATSFVGIISDGTTATTALTVNRSGGTTTLSGANTYSGGTAVQAGTLVAANNDALGTGSVSVSGGELRIGSGITLDRNISLTGGMLSGAGATSGAVTLGSGATLSPGESPGTLSLGSATFAGGSTLLWEANAPTGSAGTNWDRILLSGSLSLTATAENPMTIQLRSLLPDNSAGAISGFDAGQDYSFTLLTASGGITGYAANIFAFDATNFVNDTNPARWSVGLEANTLTLYYTAIPEPGTYALLVGIGTLLFVGWRRRRAAA